MAGQVDVKGNTALIGGGIVGVGSQQSNISVGVGSAKVPTSSITTAAISCIGGNKAARTGDANQEEGL